MKEEEKKVEEEDSFVKVQVIHKPSLNPPQKYETLDELMEKEEASAIKHENA